MSRFCFFFFCFPVLCLLSCTHARNQKDLSTVSVPPHSSVYIQGLYLFHKGDLDFAVSRFKKLNRGERDFVFGLLEIQKINYSQSRWDHFFGLAGYYRNVLLSSDERALKNFREEFLALEILALARHCRFPSAARIIQWSLQLAKRVKKPAEKIKKTISFFNLKQLIGDIKNNTGKKNEKEDTYLWPLRFKQLEKVDNPKHLRMKVKSQC